MKCTTIFLSLSAALLLTAAGCASNREHQVYGEFEAVTIERLGPHGADGEKVALPRLEVETSLSACLTYAALNNPQLEAAFYDWKAALEGIPQAHGLPDPQVTYAYYIQEAETRAGSHSQAFGLMQTFPGYGKLDARGNMAAEGAEVAHRQYESAKRQLFYRVTQAYAEFFYLGRAIEITRDNLELVTKLEASALAKLKAGHVDQSSVLKAQVEKARMVDLLQTQTDLRQPTLARLNAALGRDSAAPMPWPASLDAGRVQVDDAALLAALPQHNPDLLALDARVAMELAAARVAEYEYVPDLTLEVNYMKMGSPRMPTTGSGKDPIMANLAFNIPLWTQKYNAGIREHQARAQAARRERLDRGNTLSGDLSLALFQYHDAERKISLYRDSLTPKARQSLEAYQNSFAGDKAEFFNLIEAERTLLEFQLALERARANRTQRLAEIEMLSGQRLPAEPEAMPTPATPSDPAAKRPPPPAQANQNPREETQP